MTFIRYVDYEKLNYNVWFFFFFFKRKNTVSSETNANDGTLTTSNIDIPISENPQIKNFAPSRSPPPKVRILVPSLQPTRTDLFFFFPFFNL